LAVAIPLTTIATLCIINSPGGGCGNGADRVAVLISVCGQNVSHKSSRLQATNFHFMAEYGNPQLAKDEAGYYLTTLEAAVVFIETLSPDQLMLPTR